MKGIVPLLETSHSKATRQTNRLYDLAINLRYEGKLSLGKNLKEIGRIVEFFQRELKGHVRLEEDVIFPFLETHVPKLESVVRLLHSEHEDFQAHVENIELQLQAFSKEKNDIQRSKIIEKMRESGIYLVYLLRNHIQEERHSIYKAIDEELRREEKKDLELQIRQYVTQEIVESR